MYVLGTYKTETDQIFLFLKVPRKAFLVLNLNLPFLEFPWKNRDYLDSLPNHSVGPLPLH